MALAAREQDARVLGDETSDLAGQLRMAADSYQADEESAADQIAVL